MVKVQLQGQYIPVNPSVLGLSWNIQVLITPVIPRLSKGNVLEDGDRADHATNC